MALKKNLKANDVSSTHLKQVTLGSDTFDIAAKYIQGGSGEADKTWQDIKDLIGQAKIKILVVDKLPDPATADPTTIYLVEDPANPGTYIEYVRVDHGESAKGFSWNGDTTGKYELDLYDTGGYQYKISSNALQKSDLIGQTFDYTSSDSIFQIQSREIVSTDLTDGAQEGWKTYLGDDSQTIGYLYKSYSSGGEVFPILFLATANGTFDGQQVTIGLYLSKNGYTSGYTSRAGQPRYTWEQIGTSATDLKNYVKKGVTYSAAALEEGAHTHTVSGSVSVPTVTPTDKHLGASASGTAVGIKSSSDVLTAVKVSATDNVLGEATTFTVTPTASDTSKLVQTSVNSATATAKTASKATAGTAVVYGTADVDTAVSIPNVTANTDVTTSHVTSAGSTTAGSAASWSASVDANGVLSFSFTANTPTAVTLPTFEDAAASKVTLGTAISVTPAKAADTTRTITPYTFADVACSEVTTSEVTVATGALAADGAGASVAINGIKAAAVAANKDDLVASATEVSGNGSVKAATAIEVTTQPTITLDGNADSGVAYVSAVAVGSTTATLDSGSAASAGAHTHDVLVPQEN